MHTYIHVFVCIYITRMSTDSQSLLDIGINCPL